MAYTIIISFHICTTRLPPCFSLLAVLLPPISKGGTPCIQIPCLHQHPNCTLHSSKMSVHAVPRHTPAWLHTLPSLTHSNRASNRLQDIPIPYWQSLPSSKPKGFLHCFKQSRTYNLRPKSPTLVNLNPISSFLVPLSTITPTYIPSTQLLNTVYKHQGLNTIWFHL